MKKFRFIAVCFATLIAVSQLCACGNKKDKDDDDKDDDKKSEKLVNKDGDSKSFGSEEVSIPSAASVDLEDLDATMDYLEANATSFFPGFNRVMQPICSALETGATPTDTQANQLETFVNAHMDYIEALGALIGHEQVTNFTPEQESRVESFSNRYQDGLENLGILIGLGMAAQ